MSDLTLSMKDRVFLLNQIEILSNLNPEIDYEAEKKILQFGLEGLYPYLLNGISNHTISKEISEETFSILDMYRVLEHYIKTSKLPGIDKLRFVGFDAHQDHHTVMQVLVEDMGRYAEHKNTSYNSHSSATIDKYRDLLVIFNTFKNHSSLSDDQLQQLIECI